MAIYKCGQGPEFGKSEKQNNTASGQTPTRESRIASLCADHSATLPTLGIFSSHVSAVNTSQLTINNPHVKGCANLLFTFRQSKPCNRFLINRDTYLDGTSLKVFLPRSTVDKSPEMAASQTSSGILVAFLLLQQNIKKEKKEH